jgi:hypothetical protein
MTSTSSRTSMLGLVSTTVRQTFIFRVPAQS